MLIVEKIMSFEIFGIVYISYILYVNDEIVFFSDNNFKLVFVNKWGEVVKEKVEMFISGYGCYVVILERDLLIIDFSKY